MGSVGGLADDLGSEIGPEDEREQLAKDGVVVDEDDTKRLVCGVSGHGSNPFLWRRFAVLIRKTPIPANSCGLFLEDPPKGGAHFFALWTNLGGEVGSLAAETAQGEAQLYERHSDLVYRYCLRMLGSREEAEDAAQTTFFQALRAMRRGVVPAFEQAWLLTIARNECKSRYRSGSRRRARELTQDPQTMAELAAAPQGGDGRLVGVQQALARLPEMQRRALLLREWQGRPYSEIARELGVSRPAVEALLFRARRGLARELGEETTARKHALDVASLLAALKSALGGGAAVKVAVGLAAVATVGSVAAGNATGPVPTIGGRNVSDERPASPSAPTLSKTGEVRRSAGRPAGEPAQAPARRAAVARRTKPALPGQAQAPAAPAAPQVDQATPQAPPSNAPVNSPAPVPGAPDTPALPSPPAVPPAPPPPSLPIVGEAPPLPQLPAVPALPPAPPLPEVPEVPGAPPLPEVPDLPIVGDVPILP